jgi:hypothetical protein
MEAIMKWLGVTLTLFALVSVCQAGPQVVISEVMSNPKGRESGAGSPGDRNEYVELYNNDSVDVDMAGWLLWDGDGYDLIEAWTDTAISDPDVVIDTTVLGSGRYAVVLDPEYTSVGDTTYVQPYDFPPGTVILTVGNTTIGDGLSGNDPLSLGGPDSVFLDTYGTPDDTTDSIPFDAGDGISVERIDLRAPDREDNWAPCNDSMGTPGRENSVTGLHHGSKTMREEVGLCLEAHPNPFGGHTVLSVKGAHEDGVAISIYDTAGRKIANLGKVRSSDAAVWNGSRISPGVYFCVALNRRDRIGLKIVKLR